MEYIRVRHPRDIISKCDLAHHLIVWRHMGLNWLTLFLIRGQEDPTIAKKIGGFHARRLAKVWFMG